MSGWIGVVNWREGIMRCLVKKVVTTATVSRSIQTARPSYTVNKVQDQSWRPVKEKYLNMDIDEKRTLYFFKGNYLDLERMRPWPEQFDHMKAIKNVPTTTKKKLFPVKFPVNYRMSVGRANLVGMEVDAIVNSTSLDMMGNGGELDKLVHLAAGSELLLECMTLRGCDIGEAKITGGYRLPAKYVIHTVGPTGENGAQLHDCYQSCLNLMALNRLKSIAFPCISTQTSKFPSEAAAHIALTCIRKFLDKHPDDIDRICLAMHRNEDLAVYRDLMQIYFPLK